MKSLDPTVPAGLRPRKTTSQRRSGATVEAIFEAAIQVLLSDGLARLTTTRIAARAGCSVGTLYQYFPNKHALLFAILVRHFDEIADALENVRNASPRQSIAEWADRLAFAYVDVKTSRPEVTRALYRVAGAIDQGKLSTGIHERLQDSVSEVLTKASDAVFDDVERVGFTLLSAFAGLSRATFEVETSGPGALVRFREEASLMARAYLAAAANPCSATNTRAA